MITLNLVYPEKSDIKYKVSKFPDGQQQVTIDKETLKTTKFDFMYTYCQISSRLNNFIDLELIICTVKSLRNLGVNEIHLYVPYFLGSRSDRKFEEGSNNYLKHVICPIINSLNLASVTVMDAHSDVLDRQIEIYKLLESKGFAATNIILGVGSFTYQFNTRDSLGYAAKGSWFEADGKGYNIYKDPITDDGTKKSLKGLIQVTSDLEVKTECTWEEEAKGILQTIYEDGEFYNKTTLEEIRNNLKKLTI